MSVKRFDHNGNMLWEVDSGYETDIVTGSVSQFDPDYDDNMPLATSSVAGVAPVSVEGSELLLVAPPPASADYGGILPEITSSGFDMVSIPASAEYGAYGNTEMMFLASPASAEYEGLVPEVAAWVFAVPASAEYEGIAPEVDASVIMVVPPPASAEYGGVPTAPYYFWGEILVDGVTLEVMAPPASADYGGILPEITSSGFDITPPPASATYTAISPWYVGEAVIVDVETTASAEYGAYGNTEMMFLASPASAEYEGLALEAGIIITLPHFLLVTETILLYEQPTIEWRVAASDTANMSDAVSSQVAVLITELFHATESLLSKWDGTVSVESGLYLTDYAGQVRRVLAALEDSLVVDDLDSIQLLALVQEILQVQDVLSSAAKMGLSIEDDTALADSAAVSFLMTLLESLAMEGEVAVGWHVGTYDVLSMTADPTARGVLGAFATDTFRLTDAARITLEAMVESILSAADETVYLLRVNREVEDQIIADDEILVSRKSYLTPEDILALDEELSSTGAFNVLVQDALRLSIEIVIDGEVWECFVLNTPQFQPSVYSGFNFNSFATFEGRHYGANAEGIFELTGPTDDGDTINTGVMLSMTDFALPNKKRFRKAYLGVYGEAPVLIMATDGGELLAYEIDQNDSVTASRSLSGKRWTLAVTDFDELDFISLVPVILTRGR